MVRVGPARRKNNDDVFDIGDRLEEEGDVVVSAGLRCETVETWLVNGPLRASGLELG